MGRCGDGNPLGTKNSSDCNDLSLAHITAIESAAVVVLLESFPELTHGLWLHFIDNDASLGSFVKGSSSSIVLNSLAAKVHSICTARLCHLGNTCIQGAFVSLGSSSFVTWFCMFVLPCGVGPVRAGASPHPPFPIEAA